MGKADVTVDVSQTAETVSCMVTEKVVVMVLRSGVLVRVAVDVAVTDCETVF